MVLQRQDARENLRLELSPTCRRRFRTWLSLCCLLITVGLPLGVVCTGGCQMGHGIPDNADPQEAAAAKSLMPIAQYIRWSSDGHVAGIDVGGTALSDEQVQLLAGLKHLTDLNLFGSAVTDETLRQFDGLSELRAVGLARTYITDDSLRQLAELRNLTTLDLSHTGITDAGLKELKSLGGLKRLFIEGTKISDEGVQDLQASLPDCHIQY